MRPLPFCLALASVVAAASAGCGRMGFSAIEAEAGDAAVEGDVGAGPDGAGPDGGAPDAPGPAPDAPLPAAGWDLLPVASPSADDLWGMVAFSASDLWVVGSAGVVRQFDGATWGDRSIPGGLNLFMGWAASPSEIYVAGNGCTLQRWNGSTWADIAPNCPGNTDLYAVVGLAPDDWWAIGNGGAAYHWTGAAFVNEKFGSDTHWDMWLRASNDAYVSGSRGTLLRWDGATFTQQAGLPNETLTAVTGTPTRQFVVSNMGKILTKLTAATTWSPMTSPVATPLYDVLALADDDVWAVGASGVILHYDGAAWTQVASPTTATLRGVFAVPGGGGLRAVGDGGVVLTRL